MPTVKKSVQHADADVFTAIAHPLRRQILDMLSEDDYTATRLAAPFEVSRPAISQHLSILLDTGLVSREKRGREQIYQLRPENLAEVYQWIQHYERFWNAKLDALGDFLDEMADEEASDET